MNLKLTISVDDICPKQGYCLLGEKQEKWFRQLNEEFGCRFTLFVPSNYHNEYPLSGHKEWIRELDSIEWLELAAHGHFHQTTNPQRYGECEFFELQDVDEAQKRLDLCYSEWMRSIGKFPVGWRNPGWLCSKQSRRDISYLPLEYVAVHYEHNQNLNWDCKTFFGHDNIQSENIGIHNEDMIMFQSHIAGNHNLNVWNEANYEQLRMSIGHLVNIHTIEFKTLKECL